MVRYFSNLEGAAFVSLTTYRKSGDGVSSPLLFVDVGDKLILYTNHDSGKVKRIRNNGDVQVAPCKANGELTGSALSARARIVTDPVEDKQALAAVIAKHTFIIRMFELINGLRGKKMVRIAVESI